MTEILLDAGPSDFEYEDDPLGAQMLQEASTNGTRSKVDIDSRFVTLREFLKIKFPPAESLVGVGRTGTNLLPRFGWVMPWGAEGSGKTSIVVDLVVHAAEGRAWIDYPTLRKIKFVLVVNEGVPGGLQDKLAEKLETWDGTDGIRDTIAVYTSPWGEFTLQNRRMLEHLRDYARDFQADYVSLDPLHTVGTVGAGLPKETEQFKHLLRELGLWESLGVLTAHHSNKSGMVSGDWGRHPDTLIRIEKDGPRPASKYTLQKARPADPLELNVVQTLEWVTETRGYRRVQKEAKSPKAIGTENRDKVLEAATEGLASVDEIAEHTGLSDRTVVGHLKKLAKAGDLTLATGAKGKLTVATVGDKTEAEDE